MDSLLESNHENNGKIKVPVIKLEYILERIPFEYVEFLKIDAQENDNNVILSAGELIKKCALSKKKHKKVYGKTNNYLCN